MSHKNAWPWTSDFKSHMSEQMQAVTASMVELKLYSNVAHDALTRLNAALEAYCEGDVSLLNAIDAYYRAPYNNRTPLSALMRDITDADDLPSRLERDVKARRLANQGDRTREQLRDYCGTSCSYVPMRMAAGLDARL